MRGRRSGIGANKVCDDRAITRWRIIHLDSPVDAYLKVTRTHTHSQNHNSIGNIIDILAMNSTESLRRYVVHMSLFGQCSQVLTFIYCGRVIVPGC